MYKWKHRKPWISSLATRKPTPSTIKFMSQGHKAHLSLYLPLVKQRKKSSSNFQFPQLFSFHPLFSPPVIYIQPFFFSIPIYMYTLARRVPCRIVFYMPIRSLCPSSSYIDAHISAKVIDAHRVRPRWDSLSCSLLLPEFSVLPLLRNSGARERNFDVIRPEMCTLDSIWGG